MHRFALTVSVVGLSVVSAQAVGLPLRGAGVELKPHRAIYDLSLDWASSQSGVEGVSGRFVYEFNGGPCAGYVTDMRMVTDITKEYESVITDQVSSTFEDGEAGTFSFSNRLFSDFALQSETNGDAQRTKKHHVQLQLGNKGDDQRSLELQNVEFPTEYMENVIHAAQNGARVYQSAVYDGSGDDAMLAVTVIGMHRVLQEDEGSVSWPITTAYFPLASKPADEAPDYSVSMVLSDTGVSRHLLMDFGAFRIAGKITNLEMLNTNACDQTAQ